MTTRPGRRHTLTTAAVALLATTALGGCGAGSVAVASSPDPSGTPTPTPTASSSTSLTIVVDTDSGQQQWRLECDPPGGDHPDPAAACAALEGEGATALPPVPKDRMCTMIYGGPEKATITGTWRGAAVSATFSRTNGCEIARWSALSGLLPVAKR